MLWSDGRLGPEARVPFDLGDRGLLLGDGVFDTALILNGRVAFAAAHRDRLVAAAASLGFAVEPARIEEAMRALAGQVPRGSIRTTVTRGSGPRGLRPPAEPRPTLFASASPLTPGLAGAPLRLWPTGIRRNDTAPTARLKTLGYLDAVLAAREAAEHGFDEALFRNTRGDVACGGTGNLFAVLGERLVTPPLSDGVLDGIVRAEILRLAPACALAPEERSLPLDTLLGADAVLLTNSLRFVAPVQGIGATALASAAHPAVARLTRALSARVRAECGVAPEAVP
ncbi:aminotransferase class IV [Methylobacterium planeticum]|uniref:Probable branched-chain-amino-acid aminotransferase n=1 Tax=Methylobacterium planeticum TaxID=2615211 RepID=A0A6N6MLA4_9HYPH|nr:aminotransferase class IV [Methylobacterium planeticum]KAB1070499.1 class IV aminotransferase [Methylobacterium planeticum]